MIIFAAQVLTDREEATIIAIRGIHKIVWDFVRWEDIANNLEQDERLREAFVRLYTQVLDFLLWAVKHLRGGFLSKHARRAAHSNRTFSLHFLVPLGLMQMSAGRGYRQVTLLHPKKEIRVQAAGHRGGIPRFGC